MEFLSPYPSLVPLIFPIAPLLPEYENGAEEKDIIGKSHEARWRAVKNWLGSEQYSGTGFVRARRRTKPLLKRTPPLHKPVLALWSSSAMLFFTNRRLLTKSESLAVRNRD